MEAAGLLLPSAGEATLHGNHGEALVESCGLSEQNGKFTSKYASYS